MGFPELEESSLFIVVICLVYANKLVHGEALDSGILGPINHVIRRLGLEPTDIS